MISSIAGSTAMSEITGELAGLERSARKGEGDSKAYSEESQAVLRQQRCVWPAALSLENTLRRNVYAPALYSLMGSGATE